jgi:hypothetical protein
MGNRLVFAILGLAIVLLGVGGISLLQSNMQKEQQLEELRLLKEKERAKQKQSEAEAQAAASARKAEEERKLAQKARKEAEIEERKRIEAQAQWEEEEAKRAAAEARRQEVLRQQRQQEEQARARQAAVERQQEKERLTLKLRFKLDANRATAVPVARVHEGDRVSVRIRRINGANQPLYAGITGEYFKPFAYKRGPDGMRAVGGLRLQDEDTFTINKDLARDSQFVSINREAGVKLYIGTRLPPSQSFMDRSNGEFEVEIDILANNRFGLPAGRLQ